MRRFTPVELSLAPREGGPEVKQKQAHKVHNLGLPAIFQRRTGEIFEHLAPWIPAGSIKK